MLEWFAYLSIALKVGCGILFDKGLQFLNLGIFKLVAIFEKNVFNVSATLPSSMTISSFSIRTILSEFLDLTEKQGLIVFQKLLLSVTPLIFRFAKHFVFSFRIRDAQKFLCLF